MTPFRKRYLLAVPVIAGGALAAAAVGIPRSTVATVPAPVIHAAPAAANLPAAAPQVEQPDAVKEAVTPEAPGTPQVGHQDPGSNQPDATPEKVSAEADGPGGHQDTGANADHQFNGNE